LKIKGLETGCRRFIMAADHHWETGGMDTDDLEPRKAKPQPKNLDPMSVDELAGYIKELKAEIRRVEENMAKKKSHLTAAASLFKSR
jgi:uncharacterized small protein (DUF1192 family)